jgi:23S rRNA pseudouridine1911/1915/1917 synthase
LATHRSRVPEEAAGGRLDAWLAGLPDVATRARAERLIADQRVLVDGRLRPKSHRLEGGEEIEVELVEQGPPTPADVGLTVVFEDEHLLVVDKPAGLVTHPTSGRDVDTLVHGVIGLGAAGGDDEQRPGIVHRLDRDTSGLLLVARSAAAYEALQGLVRARDVERRYLALVVGVPASRSGRIEAPIGRDRRDRSRHSLDTETPRDAVTWFETVERLGSRALLEVRLETGRTHQIRVHLEAIGLPVAGDPVYGVAGDLGLARQFLHAYRLVLTHPFTGEPLELESPLPAALAAALERARVVA